MVERTLVLGGGGPVGVVWETGLSAGLLAEGVELALADRIIGTSAGSFVGAHLAAGQSAKSLYEAQLALAEQEAANRAAAAGEGSAAPQPDQSAFLALIQRPLEPDETPEMRRQKMGKLALSAQTIPEDAFIAGSGRSLIGLPWPQGFACTAVDAQTGAFRVWAAEDEVELVRAVASSCSVPGVFPPITIDGRRYIDGGSRSATNVDTAAGSRRVVTIAVVGQLAREDRLARIAAEARALGDAEYGLIIPDEEVLEVFGPNLMQVRDRAAIARAGFAQGRREAERIGRIWE